MFLQKTITMGLVVVSLFLTGCDSQRFASPYQTSYQRPVRIDAAPRAQISQSQLPPLGEDNVYQQDMVAGEQVAMAETPSNAHELSAANIAGVWKASVDGMPCQIATPMTKFGQGYRAGPMRCPAALANINVWNIQGRELVFYNREGTPQATLYSTDGASFVGRSSDGAQIILTR